MDIGEQKEKLLNAQSLEEAKAILAESMSLEEINNLLYEFAGQGVNPAALDDDSLGAVSGGAHLTDGDFQLNTWIGQLLRELMKKDSARNAQGQNGL